MANTVRITATTKDDASDPLDRIRDRFAKIRKEGAGSILQGVGIGAGIAAFNALGGVAQSALGYIADGIRSAREETAGIAQLTASLQENARGWDGNIDAIEKVIAARMKLGFADDEQRESLRFLVAITKDHTQALALQRLAMDLARLRGIDLATAGDIVAKVYGGNVGILSRYGIQLAKGTSATDALAQIQKLAAGQAEAFANSEQGAADTAAIAFDELQEQIGKKLLPIMTDLAIIARDYVVPALGFVADALGVILTPVRLLIDGIKWVIDTFKALGGEVPAAIADIEAPASLAATKVAEAVVEPFRRNVRRMRQAAYDAAVSYAAGLLDAQNQPKVAMDALLKVQEEALTRNEEVSYLKGVLASAELAAGLSDGRPAVQAQAEATERAVRGRLATLGFTGYTAGASFSKSVAAGIRAEAWRIAQAAGFAAAQVRGMFPGSEPKDPSSPLRGITKAWGFSEIVAQGIRSGAGSLRSAMGDALSVPAWGAGGDGRAFGLATAAAVASGSPVVIQLQVDGRTLAEVVDRQLYYMRGGPTVLPR